ncbi:MAG: hypothetical protein WBI14_09855 [Anaerolineaceae bacterium]
MFIPSIKDILRFSLHLFVITAMLVGGVTVVSAKSSDEAIVGQTTPPDLMLRVNYAHNNWIEGEYPPGHAVKLTVTGEDGTTVKATTTITTAEVPWWGGETGFSTNMDGVLWAPPGRPDIQPSDWILAEVEFEGMTYQTEVQLGSITGEVNFESDSITGTVNAPWLPQTTKVEIQCHPWGAPQNTVGKPDLVLPNGTDPYTCAWDPETEWDIQPNQQIAVSYGDPAGHQIFNAFVGYSEELTLTVHYGHDWIHGYYEPEHDVFLQVLGTGGIEKAHVTLPTGYFQNWTELSGFGSDMEGAQWIPNYPDIQPGDIIHGEVDDGTQFFADVEIGTVTGEADVLTDSITGTLNAEWLLPGPIEIGCYIWEPNGPQSKFDSVTPDGVDSYACSWEGGEWDVVPGSQLMVAYFEPDGHEVIGDFSPPAPHLRIEKWLEGGGNPGEGGNATFYVQYANLGGDMAEEVTITDTMVGMTYLGDTSGLIHSGSGGAVTWELGNVAPGDWIQFFVYGTVTAVEGDPISNTAQISTTDPYDVGEDWEKVGQWEGIVSGNDTQLNIGINPWTWNPAAGQSYVYAYTVCNNGSTGSSTVTLTLGLPTITTLESWWAREAGWSLTSQPLQPPTLEHPSIPAGQCYEVYARVAVDESAQSGDELTTTATIAAANDLSLTDNYADLHHNVGLPNVDLNVSANWNSGSLVSGGNYRFGADFRNEGNVTIPGTIELTVIIPEGTTFTGWEHRDWAEFVGEPVVNGREITWQIESLDPGYYGTVQVWLTINGDILPGTLLAHEVAIEIQPEETNTGNNFTSFEESVYEHGPNLRIRKWGDWHGFGEGHNAWYQLQVENIGDETVEDVVVRDDYPVLMDIDGGLGVNYWQWWTWENFPENNYFTVTLDRLEPGWNVNINFNVIIPGDDPVLMGQVFTNTASVTLDSADANPLDNIAEFLLGTGPDMFVEKTLAEGEFQPGEEVTYLLKFGNKQPGYAWWWNMAGNATLVDTLPEGMSFVSAKLHWDKEQPEWSEFTPDVDGQVLTWPTWAFDSGGGNEILLTVIIADDVHDGQEMLNSLEIYSDQPTIDLDPFPVNNISSYSDVVDVPTLKLFLPLIRR